MALLDCIECKGKVSDRAPACPHCGLPNESVVQADTPNSHQPARKTIAPENVAQYFTSSRPRPPSKKTTTASPAGMLKGRSKVLFASLVIGALYAFYIMSHFFGGIASSSGAKQVGASIATALVAPHMFFVVLGVIFNLLAFLRNIKWATITSLVMYCVAAVVFLLYAFFLLPNIILMAFGIGKVNALNAAAAKARS